MLYFLSQPLNLASNSAKSNFSLFSHKIFSVSALTLWHRFPILSPNISAPPHPTWQKILCLGTRTSTPPHISWQKNSPARPLNLGVLPVNRTIKNNNFFASSAELWLTIFLCYFYIVIMIFHWCHYI